jgi:MYXO-CTERM domain-containing protein
MLLPAAAFGHARLDSPVPVNLDDATKNPNGPCGTVPASPTVTTFQVGQQIDVRWFETIDHQGNFEIRFAPNGAADCPMANGFAGCAQVLSTVPDPQDVGIIRTNMATWKVRLQRITLPSTPCTNCLLQLIQHMGQAGGGPPYTQYYSCARIQLQAGPAPDMAGTVVADLGMAPNADAGPGTMDDLAGGATGDDMGSGTPKGMFKNTGCSVSHAGTTSLLGLLAAALLALALRRRRA